MISPELRFEGFDARSWINLVSLFFPGIVECTDTEQWLGRGGTEDDRPESGGTLFIIEDAQGRLLQAFHSMRGRIRDFDYPGPMALQHLCAQHHSARCVALREGSLEELSERLALRLQRGDDYLTQWLVLLRAWKEMTQSGRVHVWPKTFVDLPLPSPLALRRALDLALPDNRSFAAVLWDQARPWTAVVLSRRAGALDMVAGPDLLHQWTGPLGGDWRRDYRIIVRAVDKAVAPVHFGFFCEVQTLQRLLQKPNPGAWALAVAARDVIVHPSPPYMPWMLGTDAARAAWRTLQRAVRSWREAHTRSSPSVAPPAA